MMLFINQTEMDLEYSFYHFLENIRKEEKDYNGFIKSFFVKEEVFYKVRNGVYHFYLTNTVIGKKGSMSDNFIAEIKILSETKITCKFFLKPKILLGYTLLVILFLYISFSHKNGVSFFPLFALCVGSFLLYKEGLSFKREFITKVNTEWKSKGS